MAFTTYRPLDPGRREIRLLQIFPRDSVSRGPPRGILRHVSFVGNELPPYETVSYCWGDPMSRIRIDVDGSSLEVPVSSAQAITRVALPDKERTIWIDAVCINQADLDEQASQVALMGTVYSRATRNLIHLGQEDDAVAARSLEALSIVNLDVDQQMEQAGYNDFSSYLGALWNGTIPLPPSRLADSVDKEALLKFYNLPWFSRVWIVQEAVLSAENHCLYGDSEIDFALVTQAATWLSKFPAFNIAKGFQTCSGLMNAGAILEQRMQLAVGGSVDFGDSFAISSTLQATNPRDKVFGVLGMCFKDDTIVSGIPALLKVDYKKPMQEVYRDATKYLVLSFVATDSDGGFPFILRWISHRGDDEILDESYPSWVPRYERLGDPNLDDMTFFVHDTTPIHVDKDAEADPDDENALLIRGRKIDVVAKVSPVLTPETLQSHTRLELYLTQVNAMAESHTRDSRKLGRTLIADTNFRNKKSSESDWAGFSSLLDFTRACTLEANQSENNASTESLAMLCESYLLALQQAGQNRRFALTETGLFALVPQLCQSKDIVVAVHADSGGTPYALRPHGNDFKMIGACYVDGKMPGQDAYSVLRSQEEPSREFRIL
ncbi:heterokaryon incompatibility protein-domain-containing protein [Xylaria scruposa]|nr:heterokaryon incompatibility protein-domain-containing protein [Xylaria scruposa]